MLILWLKNKWLHSKLYIWLLHVKCMVLHFYLHDVNYHYRPVGKYVILAHTKYKIIYCKKCHHFYTRERLVYDHFDPMDYYYYDRF